MKELKEITFPPEAEEMAIKYAAFDIMKQLNKLSPTLLPSVKAYLDFLLAQQDELLSTKK